MGRKDAILKSHQGHIKRSGHEPAIGIVLLNWNGASDTLECLRSLDQQTYSNWVATVVDNGSTDDSVLQLRKAFPSIDVVTNPANVGFAAGCNVGIRHALTKGAENVLLLNNDTVLDSRCLEELSLQVSPRRGILAPVIYERNVPNRIWSAGSRQQLVFARALRQKDLKGDVVPVDFVTGCAMLIKRAVFETVGLLDEQYFMYYEDNDFCVRAKGAGWDIAVVPRARVWHKIGASLQQDTAARRYFQAASAIRFYRTQYVGWRSIFIVLWGIGRLAGSFRSGRPDRMGSMLRATVAGLWRGFRDSQVVSYDLSVPRQGGHYRG